MIIENKLISGIIGKHGFWFRMGLNGAGIRVVDHRIHPPLYSERNGSKKYIHIGPWCVMVLSKSLAVRQ